MDQQRVEAAEERALATGIVTLDEMVVALDEEVNRMRAMAEALAVMGHPEAIDDGARLRVVYDTMAWFLIEAYTKDIRDKSRPAARRAAILRAIAKRQTDG